MPATFEPLTYRPFRVLVAGRVVDTLGSAMGPLALAFAVLDLTGSSTDLGIVVGAESTAMVVFLLLGGVVADRLPRNLVLLASCAGAAVVQGVLTALVAARVSSVPLLATMAALGGALAAFAFPASSALLPSTVPEPIRVRATTLARLGTNAAMVVGSSLAGVVVGVAGPAWGLGVDAASYVAAGALFAAVRVPAVRAAGSTSEPIWRELAAGWRVFTSRRWLWVVVAAFAVINACMGGAKGVLGPVIADETFGRLWWGAVSAASTVGLVLGGLIALRLRSRRLLRLGMVCLLAEVPLLLVLGVDPAVPLLLGCAVVSGMASEQFGVAWDTSMQQHVPADSLARAYSYDMVGSLVATPVGRCWPARWPRTSVPAPRSSGPRCSSPWPCCRPWWSALFASCPTPRSTSPADRNRHRTRLWEPQSPETAHRLSIRDNGGSQSSTEPRMQVTLRPPTQTVSSTRSRLMRPSRPTPEPCDAR